jgi:23S rRNA pseudouridine1911/1915/1917 synthase
MNSIPIGEEVGECDRSTIDAAPDYSSQPTARMQAQIPAELAGMRLDQALAKLFPEHSRSRLQHWMREARISLDGLAATDPKCKIWGGEQVEVRPLIEESEAYKAEDIALKLVYEDETILVVDKPAGLVTHPGSGNWSGTLLNALLHHAPQLDCIPRAGIVHRLDKETSGLLVVAKTLEAQTDLVRQLQARTVKRQYCVLVHGVVEASSSVEAPIGRHPSERTRMAVTQSGKPARTHYRVEERFSACTLLECSLDTGRTHQIRVHMLSIGHPLVGDPVYGKRHLRPSVLTEFPRQALHAARLGLIHPQSGEPCAWQSPLPEDFATLLQRVRAEGA